MFLLPAGLAIVIRATGAERARVVFLEFVLLWILIPQALLPLVALLYASGIIQDEQEEQTITYLLDPADFQVADLRGQNGRDMDHDRSDS